MNNSLTPAAADAPVTFASSLFERGLHQYRPDIVRYVSRLGVPERMVEELTQDVLLVAHIRRADFRGQSAARTWLFGIAFHLVLNWRRRRCNREHCDERCSGSDDAVLEPCWNDASPGGDLVDMLFVRQLCARVAPALEAEPDVDRRLWLMVTFEEMSVASASRLLDVTPEQAHRMLDRTNRRVRSAVAQDASRALKLRGSRHPSSRTGVPRWVGAAE